MHDWNIHNYPFIDQLPWNSLIVFSSHLQCDVLFTPLLDFALGGIAKPNWSSRLLWTISKTLLKSKSGDASCLLLPLSFWIKIHIPCPLMWGCCFIYDFYLVYCSLFLLSHFLFFFCCCRIFINLFQILTLTLLSCRNCMSALLYLGVAEPIISVVSLPFPLPFPWTRWRKVSKIGTFSMLIFKQSLFRT